MSQGSLKPANPDQHHARSASQSPCSEEPRGSWQHVSVQTRYTTNMMHENSATLHMLTTPGGDHRNTAFGEGSEVKLRFRRWPGHEMGRQARPATALNTQDCPENGLRAQVLITEMDANVVKPTVRFTAWSSTLNRHDAKMRESAGTAIAPM